MKLREHYQQYGLCADEFKEFGHVPPQLYIRASNRLVGDYVMTQNNMAAPQNKNDSIGVANWSLDQHMTGRYAVPMADGSGKYEVQLEGNFWPSVLPHSNWYDVPYKIMLPKRGNRIYTVVLSRYRLV